MGEWERTAEPCHGIDTKKQDHNIITISNLPGILTFDIPCQWIYRAVQSNKNVRCNKKLIKQSGYKSNNER